MAKLKTSAAQMVSDARARIKEVETAEAIAMVDDPKVVIVDIRDVRERERGGFIPGSFHCPRGMAEFWVDPESPYFKDIFAQDKTFLFHCASGWRSALTVATLQAARSNAVPNQKNRLSRSSMKLACIRCKRSEGWRAAKVAANGSSALIMLPDICCNTAWPQNGT